MRLVLLVTVLAAGALAPAVAHGEPTQELAVADGLGLVGPAGQFAGHRVAGVGDVDGDGDGDLAVAGNSLAWTVPGPVGGGPLEGVGGLRIDAGGVWDFSSIQIAGAGDVNGDGVDDLVIGVRWDDHNGRADSGSVYVIFGGGPSTPITLPDLGGRGFRIDGAARGDQVGTSVDGAADFNGDGLDDVVVGTEGMGNARTGRSAYVVFGKASTETVLLNADALGGLGMRINGDRLERPGAAVAGAGDVNRDGFADVLVGAPWADHGARQNSGSAYLVYGRRGHATVWLDALGTRGVRFDGVHPGTFLGAAVSHAGDVNGDGRPDLLLGAPDTDDGGGAGDGTAFVVFSRAGMTGLDLAALTDGMTIHTENVQDDLARTLAGPGDVDRDGRADLLLGASTARGPAGPAAGAAYLVLGRAAGGPLDAADLGSDGRVLRGTQADSRLGTGVAGPGDVTGDGRPDVAVGAPRFDGAAPDVGLVLVAGP